MKRFIHIPKTGGTSIKQWLGNNINEKILVDNGSNVTGYESSGKHIAYYKYKNEKTEKFSVVRNPYHRVVSGFNYLQYKLDNKHRILPYDNFEDFVGNELINNSDPVFIPQVFWLKRPIKPFLNVEHIFKIENELEKLQEYMNYYKPIPKVNISTKAKYSKYYKSQEILKIVEEKYKEDFELLGYKIGSIK